MNYLEINNVNILSNKCCIYGWFVSNLMVCNMELNKKNRTTRNLGRRFYSNNRNHKS